MNKIEFSNSLNSVLDELSTSLEAAKKRYSDSSISKIERKMLDHQIFLLTAKFTALRKHLAFPFEARIKTMSDAEVELYRQEQLADLSNKIARLEQEKIAQGFPERSLNGAKLTKYKRDYDRLVNCQTSEEIKQYFIRKDLSQVAPTHHKVNTIFAAIAKDKDKVNIMSILMAQYTKILKERTEIGHEMSRTLSDIYKSLPYSCRHGRGPFGNYSDEMVEEALVDANRDYEKLKKVPELYEAKKEIYDILCAGRTGNPESLNMEFLEEYLEDAKKKNLNYSNLDHKMVELRGYLHEFAQLNKKIFKTKAIKEEIETYKKDIRDAQISAYSAATVVETYKLCPTYALADLDSEIAMYAVAGEQSKSYYEQHLKTLADYREAMQAYADKVRQNRQKSDKIAAEVINLTGLSYTTAETKKIMQDDIIDLATHGASPSYVETKIVSAAAKEAENKVTEMVMQESRTLSDKAAQLLATPVNVSEESSPLDDQESSKETLLAVQEKLNPDKVDWYIDRLTSGKFQAYQEKKEERQTHQQEVRDSIMSHNASQEEKFNSTDDPINKRISELEEYKNRLNILGQLRENYPELLSNDQRTILDNGDEFFRMMEESSKEPHEVDTGMSEEIRTWYKNAYSEDTHSPKTM